MEAQAFPLELPIHLLFLKDLEPKYFSFALLFFCTEAVVKQDLSELILQQIYYFAAALLQSSDLRNIARI